MRLIYFLLVLLLLSACENKAGKIPVAILTPVSHPSLEQIERGFRETLETKSPGKFFCTTYNAQGNKTLMRSCVEEIVRKKPRLVFTIGSSASQMVVEVFKKKGIQMPVVFTCVNDPVGFHIVASEERPGGFVTGVKELIDFETEIEALLQFKPKLKKVLLVYNPMEPGLDKDKQSLERLLGIRNIELLTVEVFQTNELASKLSFFMEQADAVITLKDNTVVAGLDCLIKSCNQNHIPLMASDLDSPDRGAAFGYGVYEVEFGREAAQKALLIMNEDLDPGSIPVTPIARFHLKINQKAAEVQGVDKDLLTDKKRRGR